jgi:uncharacterized protein (DUF58 family)
MHLAHRAYLLLVAAAVLAIAAIWSGDEYVDGLWRWPALLLAVGLAIESWSVRRTPVGVAIEAQPRFYLGREDRIAFTIANATPRPLTVQYAPAVPASLAPPGDAARIVRTPARSLVRDAMPALPVRLGRHAWPRVPARVLGRFGLAWWPRELAPTREIVVAPDMRREPAGRPSGIAGGQRARRVAGAGAELHQLRPYVPGDPLSRIDWKATARTRSLVSREFTEDQHLDVIVAIDAGRWSRVRAGALDRLGLFANLAARFAEEVTHNDDRIGLVVFADRPIAVLPPGRGVAAVARIRRELEQLEVEPAESDPISAVARIRSLLRHRSLVILLTDLEDATIADQLARAARFLTPQHVVVVAGVRDAEIAALGTRLARTWRDPWLALAAREQEARTRKHLSLLRRLGVPVVQVSEPQLEKEVIAEYERLRRARRV